ncbi:MAG: Beta-glucuronidase [Planctomycetes bacterium ADurb.Bin126]|nr:MAG: Beta-glucuronidase [Planctomycetes bacterium ADurb.Bin126]HOD81796.1 glycoside hydrolase family 2 TIM barrel-domain containing protein [Phycisphaerae bacterium]HQL75560.1 glycoside hydrolase family 2 TIM barrel-domain containing protein [Phycisphaerae bacterium]
MTRLVIAALVALYGAGIAAGQDWSPGQAPLMSRFAKDVSPDKVHPEYPRPQMTRPDWQNLNGLWDYAVQDKAASAPSAWQGKILVPFPIESALSGVTKRVSEEQRLWYRRSFEVPSAWAGKRILLNFGAVDWQTTVCVNGKEVGRHQGGYDPFSLDITDALKSGVNELTVAVWDPTDAGYQPRGKQVRNPRGIWYTPITGIWQTVWLEPVAAGGIEGLKIVPDVDAGCVRVTVKALGQGDATAELQALDGEKSVATASGAAGSEIKLPIADARLWSPDSPFLYDLKVTLKQAGKAIDSVGSYFGMRKIALGKDDKGVNRILLNGKFVFQVGPLDQGFWPDGLYTAPTDEALRYDLEMTRKFGMNCTRKHVKVEPLRWYYWCDRLGLLVWQDMPSGDKYIHGNQPDITRSKESAENFERELKALIDSHFNSPSIIMWVIYNEGWGQWDTPRMTEWATKYDPTRLINQASGWTDRGGGHVHDMHAYPGPNSPKPTEQRAAVLGEFGGLGLGVEGHSWAPKSAWGYRKIATPEALTREYVKLLVRTYQLIDDPGLSAAIYTQITDVESEVNGLLSYDRKVVKMDVDKVADANRGKAPPPPQYKIIVPASRREGQTWRYVTDKPADGWQKPGFDASSWKEGKGGFGTRMTPGAVVGTVWKSEDIWLVREFELDDAKLKAPQLRMHHDEDAEVYINGVLAAKINGFTTDYEEFDIDPKAVAALKAGKNTLAVHCKQTMGGQFIDVGIVDVK